MLYLLPRWHRFDWNRFTDRARWVIGAAQHCAFAEDHPTIDVQHLIRAANLVQADLYRPPNEPNAHRPFAEPKPFSPEARAVIALAWQIKNHAWSRYLCLSHMVAALNKQRRRP
jgi:hypothetical protein